MRGCINEDDNAGIRRNHAFGVWRDTVVWNIGTLFALPTGPGDADDSDVGKWRLCMKEIMGQYAKTIIAGMVALVLGISLLHLPSSFGKMLPKTNALVQEKSQVFENCWRIR